MDLWVFAYGSLMWKPGFQPAETRRATLAGYRRGFCLHSIHHRGSADSPGLVLALEPADAHCEGLALRAAPDEADAVLAMLRERELISSAYLERQVTLHCAPGPVSALAYVVDTDHAQYAHGLSPETQAQIIARASGGMGPNWEYLFATAAHLEELAMPDPDMAALARRVRDLRDGFRAFA